MAVYTATKHRSGFAKLEVLQGGAGTQSGARNDWINLPAGYGDCLLTEAMVVCSGVTLAAIAENVGPLLRISDSVSGQDREYVQATPWVLYAADGVAAAWDLDSPRLWRASEGLRINWSAIESAGSYSWTVHATVRPLRNEG